jgi:alanyl-tRNA synthetase
MDLFNAVNEALESGTQPAAVVETLANALYRQSGTKQDASLINVGDFVRQVATTMATTPADKLSFAVKTGESKKAITSAANGKKGGRPKGSTNKTKAPEVEAEAPAVTDAPEASTPEVVTDGGE